MKHMPAPDLSRLKQLYSYDSRSGLFTHKRNSAWGKIGTTAGTLNNRGYIIISLDYRSYAAHRLAWYYVHGLWPDEIDHHDRNKTNNRISNLRDATHSQNMANGFGWNSRKYKLPRGVYHMENGYMSRIVVNRKPIYLGYFRTVAEAQEAYRDAAHKHFGEFTP